MNINNPDNVVGGGLDYSLPTGEKTSRAYDIEIAQLKQIIETLENNIEMMKFDADALRKQRVDMQMEMSDLRRDNAELNKLYNGKN